MYSCLKVWMNIPITIKPFIKYTGTGAKSFGDNISTLCYPHDEIKLVRSHTGEEVVSNRQLYIDGNIAVNDLDVISIEGAELDIKAISTYYRNGTPDIKVVYL